MAKISSIHVRNVSSGSEQHNKRERELSYVRKDLTYLNSSFEVKSIATARAEILAKYKATTGQKMQDKAKPIREAVLLIEAHHTADDLKNLGEKIEQRFGIKTIQAYAHKDEGHYDIETKEWKPNHHAHMIFDWTDTKTGKAIRMSKEDMSELQTIVADGLNMKRGVKSTKKHIESTKFKAIKEENDLEKVRKVQEDLEYRIKDAKSVLSEEDTDYGLPNFIYKPLSVISDIVSLKTIKDAFNVAKIENKSLKDELTNAKSKNLELMGRPTSDEYLRVINEKNSLKDKMQELESYYYEHKIKPELEIKAKAEAEKAEKIKADRLAREKEKQAQTPKSDYKKWWEDQEPQQDQQKTIRRGMRH